MFFTDVDNIYICIILKESVSANHIIFFDYLTGMKIIFPENSDIQYSKNVLHIIFFRIVLQMGTDLHKHSI